MDPLAFLLPGSRFRCLPNNQTPRLYLTGASPLRRWQESAFYPAYRRRAKVYRFLLRVKAVSGYGAGSVSSNLSWAVEHFVEGILPSVSSVVALVGTPGPAQKIILQLWDNKTIVGYLKYAEKPAAKVRLEREAHLLTRLPEGLGPVPLKFGPLK